MASVARATVQIENTHLTFELINRTEHDWNTVQRTGVINQVAGLVVVGAVDHQIVTINLFKNVRRIKLLFFGNKFNVLIDVFYLVSGRGNFWTLEIARTIKHLTLQVFQRYIVKIDDFNGSDSCRGKVLDYRRTERACTRDKDFGCLDALLPFHANFFKHQVLAESFHFAVVERYAFAAFIRNKAYDSMAFGLFYWCATGDGWQ